MELSQFICACVLFFDSHLVFTSAEYRCLCVFDTLVHPIYEEPNITSNVIGFLPPNQCKYFLFPVSAEFGAIMVFHQKGFIHLKTPGMVQTCEGNPSAKDIFTTALPSSSDASTALFTKYKTSSLSLSHTNSNQPSQNLSAFSITTLIKNSKYTTSSENAITARTKLPMTLISESATASKSSSSTSYTVTFPTSTSITTPESGSNLHFSASNTYTIAQSPSRTAKSIPSTAPSQISTDLNPRNPQTSTSVSEGHIEACPDYIKNTDVNRHHGFLGQYGEFCYELIDTPTQWENAERHCALVSQGHLVQVLNQGEQKFLVRFLNQHHYVKGVWLGLTDSGDNSVEEGNWRWVTGAAYQYNNFQSEYARHSESDHKYSDCVLFKQGGEWTDVSCGTTFAMGIGFGETHPYICQYNISQGLPSILDSISVVVG